MTQSINLLHKTIYNEYIPEEFDKILLCPSLAVCNSFNRQGSLLAIGCNDGHVFIWDYMTRDIVRDLYCHDHRPVASVNYSRNSHRLVSAALDNCVCIWQLLTGDCLMRLQFPSPILKVSFNPRNDTIILVSLQRYPSVLIYIDYENLEIKYTTIPLDMDDNDTNVVSAFDRRGKHIYTGNSKGKLTIIKCPSVVEKDMHMQIISSFRIQKLAQTQPGIRDIEFGVRNKNLFLINCSDKAIRLYQCEKALNAGVGGNCTEERRFQDLINKTLWRKGVLSGDKDATYVLGGSSRRHDLYIWESQTGALIKMIHGTTGDYISDICWHPLRPIITTIAEGYISVFIRPQIENWNACAVDFTELEECMEYEERESEFDIEDEDLHPGGKREKEIEPDLVDVIISEPPIEYLSSDEEDMDPNYLAAIPVSITDVEKSRNPPDPYLKPEKKPKRRTGYAERDPEMDMISKPLEMQVKPNRYIEILLENPPINEKHPLTAGSGKRVRFNDSVLSFRKNPKVDKPI